MIRLAVSLAILLAIGGISSLAQQFYVTQPGDNLFRIALRNGITVEALAAANGIGPPYTIHVGNRLTVPAPWCPEDEAMSPAVSEEDADAGDPNLCYGEWTDCGDGSTPESVCRWQVGWCIANLGLDAQQCQAKFCGDGKDEPESKPKRTSKPERTPEPEPEPTCVFIQRYDNGNEIPWDAIDTFCMKVCSAGYPPVPNCESRGYNWPASSS